MDKIQQIEKYLTEMISARKIAGCAATVWQKGKCVFRAFKGTLDGEHAVGEHSAFRLASMTKPITAVAVLLCVQDGLLKLTDPISAYLPAFFELWVAKKTEKGYIKGERAKPVTIWNLLTHTSGIGSGEAGNAQYDVFKPREGDTLASAVDRYAGILLDFQPGSAQMYSPVMALDIAARIVEVVSGKPYDEFLKERIFRPLGMEETSYRLTDYRKEDLALTCKHEDGKLIAEPLLYNFNTFPAGYTGGGAELLSTLDDYCRFAEMLRRVHAGGEGILSPALVREMATPQLDGSYAGVTLIFNWGLAVRTLSAQTDDQPLSVGSFGWSGAYGTHFWVDPSKQLVAVYMHNSATYGGAGAPHTYAFERAVMKDFE